MKRFCRIFPLLACFPLLFCGCKRQEKPKPAPAARKGFSWMICDTEAKFSGKWTQYAALNRVSAQNGVTPEITLVTKETDRVIAKAVLAGDLPDAVTLRLDDRNLQKLLCTAKHRVFTAGEVVPDPIPAAIFDRHRTADGTLSYLPGGYSGDGRTPDAACEGVFVRSDVFPAERLAQVTGLADLPALLREYVPQGKDDLTEPVLFGERGFETLAHLYGITTDALCSAEAPKRLDGVTAFLCRLTESVPAGCTVGTGFSPDRLPLIFFGERSAAERMNEARGTELYRPLYVTGAPDGFLASCPADGVYATVVTDGANADTVTAFLLGMMQSDVSRALMYGEKNTNWLIDTQYDQVVIPNETAQRVRQGDASLLSDYGLAVFPYLSCHGAVYAGYAPSSLPLRDPAGDRRLLCGDPTVEPFRSNIARYGRLEALCTAALAVHPAG